MKTESINFKLLSLMIMAFLLTVVSVIFLVNRQANKIIDKSQNEVYAEKLGSILGFLERNYKTLQDTLMVEAYKEQFKSKAITVVQTDYADKNKDIYPFIIDTAGHVVMHPKIAVGTNLDNIDFIKKLIAKKNGNLNYTYNGQNKWVIFKHFQGWDWYVGYAIPLDIKYADSRHMRNELILIVSVIAAIIVSILSIILTKFTKPIIELTHISSEMAAGRLDCYMNISRKDEIGVLASSFEKMRLAVKDKIALIEQKNFEQTQTLQLLKKEVFERKEAELKLAQINQELEKIVSERTANLVETVKQLECEIIERKRAEEKMQELNESLKGVNEELKNFAYIASHDLREPLRKITSFGSMLESSLQGKVNEEEKINLRFMVDGATRMKQMIDGLLNYSRVSTNTQEFENIEMNHVISELIKFELGVLLEETKTKLNIPQPLPAISADPLQISQLMQNLIANGIKYQKKGNIPEITITSKPAANNMVRIEITDNGIGIAAEYHSSVFAMFKRLHTRNEYEGTGIGLAVCKKIVLRHGGQIGVESQQGNGSTFWFTVPGVKVGVSRIIRTFFYSSFNDHG